MATTTNNVNALTAQGLEVTNSVTKPKPRMHRADKGKSKYQLKVEADDPNVVTTLRRRALVALREAIDRGDVRAITFVLESTNAMKQVSGQSDVRALASLLPAASAAPSKRPKEAPQRNVDISSHTTFSKSDSQPTDSTGDSQSEAP